MRSLFIFFAFCSGFVMAQEEFGLDDLNAQSNGKYYIDEYSEKPPLKTIIRVPQTQSVNRASGICRASLFDVMPVKGKEGKYTYKKKSKIDVVYVVHVKGVDECKNWKKYAGEFIRVDDKIEDGIIWSLVKYIKVYSLSSDARCDKKITLIKLDDSTFSPRVVNSVWFSCGRRGYEAKVIYDPEINQYVLLQIRPVLS